MKYTQHAESYPGEWSRWVSPIHGIGERNYRFACCDCGLVHELQFRVKEDHKQRASVVFRARRNNRATAAMRRKHGEA